MLIDFSLLPLVLVCWMFMNISSGVYMICKAIAWLALLLIIAGVGLLIYAGSAVIDEMLKALVNSEVES